MIQCGEEGMIGDHFMTKVQSLNGDGIRDDERKKRSEIELMIAPYIRI